jgi:hypothetical protein
MWTRELKKPKCCLEPTEHHVPGTKVFLPSAPRVQPGRHRLKGTVTTHRGGSVYLKSHVTSLGLTSCLKMGGHTYNLGNPKGDKYLASSIHKSAQALRGLLCPRRAKTLPRPVHDGHCSPSRRLQSAATIAKPLIVS